VCRRWRGLAGARHLWQEKGEVMARDGVVNWPAFKNLGKIRQKRHSMVVKCESRVTGCAMVVKRILTNIAPSESQEHSLDQGFPVRYLREVSLLRACDHPNVMRLHFVHYRKSKLELFSEYVGQNLEDYIAGREPCDHGSAPHAKVMAECRDFLAQILAGVAYSHCIGIILRDIKPRNVMLDTSGSGLVKLTGFALGRFASPPSLSHARW